MGRKRSAGERDGSDSDGGGSDSGGGGSDSGDDYGEDPSCDEEELLGFHELHDDHEQPGDSDSGEPIAMLENESVEPIVCVRGTYAFVSDGRVIGERMNFEMRTSEFAASLKLYILDTDDQMVCKIDLYSDASCENEIMDRVSLQGKSEVFVRKSSFFDGEDGMDESFRNCVRTRNALLSYKRELRQQERLGMAERGGLLGPDLGVVKGSAGQGRTGAWRRSHEFSHMMSIHTRVASSDSSFDAIVSES